MKEYDHSDTQPILPENPTPDRQIQKIPKFIGPYKIEILLQRGGMSNIYLGTDPNSKEPLIIKSLLPKYLSQNDIVERFLREAEIIALADHPNIVKMLSHGEWEGGHYIAMEFITGISLRQFILQKPMSLKRALEILLDVSYALCHLHAHGVIHRDLKPENILISDAEEVKVIDFGIAQLLSDSDESTEGGDKRTIGTPIYMSPEQRENAEAVSYPSDIYSLGIIAYELILGRLSHGQIHLSLMPKGIQKILSKALQPSPEDRYQDVVDLIADLSAYLASDNINKERNVNDRFSDLFNSFKRAQKIIQPAAVPIWPGLKLGMTSLSGLDLNGIYAEFLHLSDYSLINKSELKGPPTNFSRYAIIIGEPLSKDAEGILLCALVRGMVHALLHNEITAKELVTKLNNLLSSSKDPQQFAFCCLILDQQRSQLQFISCGYGAIWHFTHGQTTPRRIESKNPTLGSGFLNEFSETIAAWNNEDQVLIYGYPIEDEKKQSNTENLLLHGMIEYAGMPPSGQVTALLRKLKLSLSNFSSIPILIKAERKKILTGN